MGNIVASPALLPQPAEMTSAGAYLYLYAIVAARPLDTFLQGGIDPTRPVYLLGSGRVQAVVSAIPAADFTQEAIASGLQDAIWVERHVRAHQRVLDQLVASRQTILPLRFCTIYRDEATVQALLAARESALLAELVRLWQKQEWGVKLFVELATLQTALFNGHTGLDSRAPDDEIAVLRRRIAGLPNGAAFLYKKKLETLVATRADEYAFALADESHARLARYAVAAVTNPLPQVHPDLRLNAAYLLAMPDVVSFRHEVETLGECYAALGVCYEVSGPWPAYNFLNLTLDE